MTTPTLPARLLSDIDDLLSAVPAKIHDETRWVRDACAALREAAAALSARVPEGDVAQALEWVRTHAMFSSDPAVWAHCAAIEEAIAAYDPERAGAFSGKLSGREAVAWLCVSPDGVQVDATASENTLADYARFGRTITPLYTTPQPGGGVVVPREPTEAMLDAALRLQGDDAFLAKAPAVLSAFGKIYRAMLAAAPSAKGVA